MPRGPKGEKRPGDVIGNAVHVMRIATGEAGRSCCDRGWRRWEKTQGLCSGLLPGFKPRFWNEEWSALNPRESTQLDKGRVRGTRDRAQQQSRPPSGPSSWGSFFLAASFWPPQLAASSSPE